MLHSELELLLSKVTTTIEKIKNGIDRQLSIDGVAVVLCVYFLNITAYTLEKKFHLNHI